MIGFSGKREAGSTLSKNRANILKILRLVLLTAILFCYFKPTSTMIESFFNATVAKAKNNFLFVHPAEINGQSDVSDFTTFYAAGLLNKERFTRYHELDIYDPYLLTQSVERLIAPMQPAEVYSIQYPPIFFAITTPLTFFDLSTAWRMWAFISALCVIVAFVCIAYDQIIKRPLLLIGLLIFLTCSPVVVNFTFGQMTILQAVLLAITFRLLLEKIFFGRARRWSSLF